MNKKSNEIETPAEMLAIWSREADKMEEAIASRNYLLFKNSFRKGSKGLNAILKLIEKDGKDIVSTYRDEIESLAARWKTCSKSLPAWMNEMKEKIKIKNKAKINDKKIGNAYKFLKKSGNNLRVKAK